MTAARAFRGFRFPAGVVFWTVHWYLRFPVSYRDLEAMLADRGVEVDHTTVYRGVQRFAPELEARPPRQASFIKKMKLVHPVCRRTRAPVAGESLDQLIDRHRGRVSGEVKCTTDGLGLPPPRTTGRQAGRHRRRPATDARYPPFRRSPRAPLSHPTPRGR